VIGGLLPVDPQHIGRYRLVGRLGCGGMGRVFLGLSAGGRPVAVKVIRAELAADQEFRIRFSREVAAARRVSGMFTALVVDADVDGVVPWLATAYVPGPSLADAVARHGPMPPRAALALAAGLAEGLGAIHAASVVHCDLKPSNVLLSPDGPRVIDFGISRAAEAVSVPGADLAVGSPGFMSPEQATGAEVGPPSDIFSLGAVLAFAVTGQGPFGEGSGPELAYRLVYHQPSLDLVSAELRPLVERCLAKEPAQRPTADELLTEVGALQPAIGWRPDLALGAFAEEHASDAISSADSSGSPPRQTSSRQSPSGYASSGQTSVDRSPPGRPSVGQGPRGRIPMSRRRGWRPLAAAGTAAGVLAASAAVSWALSGAASHSSATQLQPRITATRSSTAGGGASVADPRTSPSRSASSTRGAGTGPLPAEITPAADTISSPGTTTPSASPSASPSVSPSPSASESASPTASPTPTPSPSPSITPAPPVPQITGVSTYRNGAWVYFEVQYSDPGQDAEGFGFTGSNGLHWVDGQYPFTSPDGGIVGPGSIAYPLDLECGTVRHHTAQVEAWIYDSAGASSPSVVINLSCTS
jgi:eukaryotic-like serine/threonine-protein kinase